MRGVPAPPPSRVCLPDLDGPLERYEKLFSTRHAPRLPEGDLTPPQQQRFVSRRQCWMSVVPFCGFIHTDLCVGMAQWHLKREKKNNSGALVWSGMIPAAQFRLERCHPVHAKIS